MVQQEPTWVTLKAANAATGFHVETLRGWANNDPKIRTRLKNGRREVDLEDVKRRAAATNPRRGTSQSARPAAATAAVLDRVATLEEIVRRQRLIDEYREEVERRHLEIALQYREIAELALGPSLVPDL